MKSRLLIPLLALSLVGAGCNIPGLGPKDAAKGPDGGLWKSANAGSSWAQAVTLPGPKGVGTLANVNVLAFEADPSDASILYLGTRENGLFVSEDAAASWRQPRAATLREGAISAVAVDPKAGCTVYAARGARVMKSTDCLRGVTDAYVDTRAKVEVAAVVVDWYDPNVVWLGLTNGDVLKSLDAGRSWRTVNATKANVSAILVSRADSRQVLVGTQKGGFFRTNDGGATWKQVDKELKDFRNGNKVTALVGDKGSGTVIAATGYGLLKSRDFGATWEALTLLTAPGQVAVKAVAIDPKKADRLFYATAGTFYQSTDAGVTWSTRPLPSAREPQVLQLAPDSSDTLFLGVAAATQ
ncbi:hypothetical protein A2856_03410 [Candidatus Uhrbacteria bacterium RIFCSPHIGHO2_01_FULL_63_20]|uniref:Photosynthesis system II assembly factor Ycf48/Hcf136-like domain-containing protein n=1 Tax=Candidatus Uhrbacteria bacterium RIFCSPHIGHO2_01_FULL_63_20 TaxID=1802385 RepID=A0A1F7TMN0_9BACT|nr:MAG: hypothetical protein A2856_03410 [Candidatus Uhrbacteria bacterium RIFCSPHIGHO2_01_FULL_63_20]